MAEIYDNALCTVNGKLLVQASSISVAFQDGDKAIMLLGAIFAPVPTQRVMVISIDEFIPTSGLVFDWIKSYLNVELVTFGVRLQGSGKKLITSGVLKSPDFQFGVAQNSRIKVSFVGPPAQFE